MMVKTKLGHIREMEQKLINDLDSYAVDGLRTLMYAMRILNDSLV